MANLYSQSSIMRKSMSTKTTNQEAECCNLEALVPNQKTIEALKEVSCGEGERFDSVEAFMASLLADLNDEND